jgi:hypothetical protein
VFDDDESYLHVQLPSAPEYSSQSIREKIDEVKRKCPKQSKPSGYSGADLSRGVLLWPEEIDEYNQRLDNYYRSYEKYLEEMHRFETLKWGTVRLDIALSNRGGAPAEDIDVFMHFPHGFGVYDQGGLGKAIVMPPEPERPKTRLELMAEGITAMRAAPTVSPSFGLLNPALDKSMKTVRSNVGDWSIKEKNSYDVHTHVTELKHNFRIALEPLFVVFPSREAVQSFAIDYELLAANVPDKIEERLHVRVETS